MKKCKVQNVATEVVDISVLSSPARKRCWNISPAHRIFFSQQKEKQVFYIILKLCLFCLKRSRCFILF